jgi:hypothetical protein
MKIMRRYWIATLSTGERLRIPIVRRGRPCLYTMRERRRRKRARGMGINRGFEPVEYLICCHGGNRNDTIVTVERKR